MIYYEYTIEIHNRKQFFETILCIIFTCPVPHFEPHHLSKNTKNGKKPGFYDPKPRKFTFVLRKWDDRPTLFLYDRRAFEKSFESEELEKT